MTVCKNKQTAVAVEQDVSYELLFVQGTEEKPLHSS